MMKKILCIVACMTMLLTFVACQPKTTEPEETTPESETVELAESETVEETTVETEAETELVNEVD